MTQNQTRLEAVLWWLSKDKPPDMIRMVNDVDAVIMKLKRSQRVIGSYAVESALAAAYWLGRQSLVCHECGDYVPPDDAYCDCWRDKRFLSQEDGIWCPACGEIFHDEDINANPNDYHQCPKCGCVTHTKCRSPAI